MSERCGYFVFNMMILMSFVNLARAEVPNRTSLSIETFQEKYRTADIELKNHFQAFQATMLTSATFGKTGSSERAPAPNYRPSKFTGYYTPTMRRVDREVTQPSPGSFTSYVKTGSNMFVVRRMNKSNSYSLEFYGKETPLVKSYQAQASQLFEVAYKAYFFDVKELVDGSAYVIDKVTTQPRRTLAGVPTESVELDFHRKSNEPPMVDGKPVVVYVEKGRVTLDGLHQLRVASYDLQMNGKGRIVGEATYAETEKGLFFPKTLSLEMSKNGGTAYHVYQMESFDFTSVPDETFSTQAFGIDISPSADMETRWPSNSMILAGIGLTSLLTAFVFKFRKRKFQA